MTINKLFTIYFSFLIVLTAESQRQNGPVYDIVLKTNWNVKNTRDSNYDVVNMTIPFSVHSALSSHGKIPEPYYRFNDLELRWIPKDNNWKFVNTFKIDGGETTLNNTIVNIEFHSIDSVARVYLNRHFVLFAQNEFLKYTIENVNSRLKSDGLNVLEIEFLSPIEYAKNISEMYPYRVPVVCPPDVQKGECHVNKLRKQQSSFSWDWGPAFAPMSLYEDVVVKVINTYDMSFSASVYPKSINPNGDANLYDWIIDIDLTIQPNLKNIVDNTVTVKFQIPNLPNANFADQTFKLDLTRVKTTQNLKLEYSISSSDLFKDILWYPNGFGKQNLFELNVECHIDNKQISKQRTVGLRSVQLIQDPINPNNLEHGLTFYFKINNKAIFLKGSNWIPADSFQENITDDYMEWLMKLARDYNMNSLRIWGGGLYERKQFYDLADRMGIMIWHDLMFACSVYQTNPDFLTNVQNEVTYQINRLRNHPSIILWAGNNENEVAVAHNWYNTNEDRELYRDDYRKLYVDVLKTAIRDIEPEISRPYLVSSPSNAKASEEVNHIAENPYDWRYGDVHFYNYEINGWIPENYPVSRMVSEYGFQSFPSYGTLKNRIDEDQDADWESAMSEHRQHHGNGNKEMEHEILQNLNLPSNKENKIEYFKNMIYLTQLNQAMSLKASTEMFIRIRDFVNGTGFGKCYGAMYWQFNDIWEGVSWSSIEFGGKPKMAHYYMKDIFSNLLASPYLDQSSNTFNVLLIFSEYPNTVDGEFTITVHSYDSFDVKYTETVKFSIEPHTSKLAYSKSIPEIESLTKCKFNSADSSCLIKIHYKPLDYGSSSDETNENFFFMNNRLADVKTLKTPKIEAEINEKSDHFEIVLTTSDIALFVWLDYETSDFVGLFSDNGFHMTDKTRTVTFTPNKKVSKSEFEAHFKVHSLMNIYKPGPKSGSNKLFNVYKSLFFILINLFIFSMFIKY